MQLCHFKQGYGNGGSGCLLVAAKSQPSIQRHSHYVRPLFYAQNILKSFYA